MDDYFVWETRRRNLNTALVPEFPNTFKPYGVNFLAGRRFIVPVPELELRIPPDSDGMLPDDLAVFKYRCVAHSDRLQRVLRKAGVDNIDYYPLRVIREATGDIYGTHQAPNILDVIFCVDHEKSELYIDDENPFNLWFIDRLVLDPERLGDTLCFRLGERLTTVIVHRVVKEAIEDAGITGPVFLPADGYREYRGFGKDNPTNVVGTHDDDPDGAADYIPGQDEDDSSESADERLSEDG